MATPTAEHLARLESKRSVLRRQAEQFLDGIAEKRGSNANLDTAEQVKFAAMTQDIATMDETIRQYAEDLERVGELPVGLAHRVASGSGAEQRGRLWSSDTADRLRAMGGEARAVVSGSLDVPVLLDIPPVAIPFPKRLIDVLGNRMQLQSDGLAYEYYKQTAPRVNNAAPVPDLAAKPTSQLTVTAVQERCRVIATLSDYVPTRIYWHFDQINNWLYNQLYGCVLDEIEQQVISGDGSGENMTGILNTAGTTNIAFATDVPTTLRGALSAMQTLGEVPTAWCLNPVDAQNIDLLRWDPTGVNAAGGFLSGGYENDTGNGFGTSANIFGPDSIRRVVTPHLPAGTALLADFAQLLLVFQQYMRLDIDAYTGFNTNSVRFRAESFVGFGVLRPQAFAVINLGSGTTTTRTPAKK